MSYTTYKGQIFYHWVFGKMKVSYQKDHMIFLRVLEPEGVSRTDNIGSDLTDDIQFKTDAINVILFKNKDDVYKTNVDMAKSKAKPHKLFVNDELLNKNKKNNAISNDKKTGDSLYDFQQPSDEKHKYEATMNIVQNTSGEKLYEMRYSYIKLWKVAEKKHFSPCKFKNFKDIKDYSDFEKALAYTYYYANRYALDAFEVFDTILSKKENQDIRTIVIVGSGNNLDLMGLNYYLTENPGRKIYNVVLIDPTIWGYYPHIRLNKRINLLKKVQCVTEAANTLKTEFTERKLVIFSRVFNESLEGASREQVANTAYSMTNNKDIVCCIFANSYNPESKTNFNSILGLNIKSRNFNRMPDNYSEIVGTMDKYISEKCEKNYCDKNHCNEDYHGITRYSYSSYEMAIKEQGGLYDYFSQ